MLEDMAKGEIEPRGIEGNLSLGSLRSLRTRREKTGTQA